MSNKIHEIFSRVGSALFISGLNHSHSGNMSLRCCEKIYITWTGSMKGFLKKSDILCVDLNRPSPLDAAASSEINVHRAIYRFTGVQAVIHTHPPITTALAFRRAKIIPMDVEGRITLPGIPVLKYRKPTASEELGNKLPPLLKKHHSVIIKGHGVFSAGNSLEDAFHYASLTEHISKIIYYAMLT